MYESPIEYANLVVGDSASGSIENENPFLTDFRFSFTPKGAEGKIYLEGLRWNTAAAKSLLDKIPENTPTELT